MFISRGIQGGPTNYLIDKYKINKMMTIAKKKEVTNRKTTS
jgi:hypothetical protein